MSTLIQPPTSGGSPGGANKAIQFNNGGIFGGLTNFAFDDTTGALTVTSNASSAPSPMNLVSTAPGGSVLFSGYSTDPNGYSEFDVFNDTNNPGGAALTMGFFGSNSTGFDGEGTSAYVITNGAFPLNLGCDGVAQLYFDGAGNVGVGTFSKLDFGGGVGVFPIAECAAPPAAPSQGYILYVQGGALMGIGTGGTVTTIGLA